MHTWQDGRPTRATFRDGQDSTDAPLLLGPEPRKRKRPVKQEDEFAPISVRLREQPILFPGKYRSEGRSDVRGSILGYERRELSLS